MILIGKRFPCHSISAAAVPSGANHWSCGEPLSFHFSFIIYCLLLALYSSNQAITSLYFPVMSIEFPGPHKETGCCLLSLVTLRRIKAFRTEHIWRFLKSSLRLPKHVSHELEMSKCVCSLVPDSVQGINILRARGLLSYVGFTYASKQMEQNNDVIRFSVLWGGKVAFCLHCSSPVILH
jgi:hypothetical protein